MRSVDRAWVAGLLEGEGCFTKKCNAGTARNITVVCQMTDRDVVERLHRVAGGTFHGPYANGPRGRLPRFMWRISGTAAYRLMVELLPLMGKRRSARIRGLLAAYDSVETPTYRIKHLASGRIVETKSLTKWLVDHGVSESGLYRTLTGARAQCRGWRRLA